MKRYNIVRLLGRGAFGEVNLIKNSEDNRLYACKTIYCEKEEYLTESLKEVRIFFIFFIFLINVN
jgi:serine/threonine protein kinase